MSHNMHNILKLFRLFVVYLQRYETKVKLMINTLLNSEGSIIPLPINDDILEDLATFTLTPNSRLEDKIIHGKPILLIYYL